MRFEDYQRASAIKRKSKKNIVYNSPNGIQWQNEDGLTYLIRTAAGIKYVKVNPDDNKKKELFNRRLLALAEGAGKYFWEKELQVCNVNLKKGKIQFESEHVIWEWDEGQNLLEKIKELRSSNSRY